MKGVGKTYRCEKCHQWTLKPEVDHIVPVGKTPGAKGSAGATWDELFKRLFCSADGLRVLCHACHQKITHAVEEAG